MFNRNETTGALSFVEIQQDGVGGVDGLAEAYSVIVSSDGKYVYVAGGGDDAVAVFNRNETTGTLSFVDIREDEVGDIGGLAGATSSMIISPDDKHLYIATWLDDTVTVFSRNGTTGALGFVEIQRDGVGGIDGLGGTVSAMVSPDGKHLYAAGAGDNAVAVFSRNETTGALSYVEMQQNGINGVDGLGFVRSVTVSPDGKHLYAVSSGDNAVVVFSRNETTGALSFVEMQQDGVGGVDGLGGAWSVKISPDGKHLYAVGSNDNAVAVFSRNETTGALSFVEMQQDEVGGVDGLSGARSVTVSPDGKYLYVAGGSDQAVAVFSRNETTGILSFVEIQQDGVGGVDGLAGANAVMVSLDGKHLYVAGGSDQAVAVFNRNETTGTLSFVEMQQNGVNGVDGLSTINAVTVSPDGKYLFTTAWLGGEVAVFSRDETTGALSFVEVQRDDGIAGVHGLDNANAVVFSPDGKHLYVTGGKGSVVSFSLLRMLYMPIVSTSSS